MPHYDFICEACDTLYYDIFFHMEETKEVVCCGKPTERVWSRPEVNTDFYMGTVDPNFGHEPILLRSRKHRRDLLKRHGLYEAG